ncbi:MAG: hypothetical protein RQ783_08185 [Gammaproteobacteria bacterium]|nr:hypothetical protein [Gammaproteobacteria bacterium]
MTLTWTQLLEQQPASLADIAPLENSAHIIPLPQMGVLQVSGDDAVGFLQNLVTNNINALAINQGQLSGLCNPKGRLLAIFLVIRRQDYFYLILPGSMCAGLMQRLSMYILRSNVSINEVSQQQVCLGLLPNGNNNLPLSDYPDVIFDAVDINAATVIKLPSNNGDRFLFVGSSEQATALATDAKTQNWQLTSDAYWELSDIVSGLAMIYPETKEDFTAQQVNLDLVGGVSFNKGCYPGQEIVARLHYLGSPSRRMFIAQLDNCECLEIGQDILTEDGSVAGQLVRWIKSENGAATLLLSLKLTDYQSALVLNGQHVDLVSDTIPA